MYKILNGKLVKGIFPERLKKDAIVFSRIENKDEFERILFVLKALKCDGGHPFTSVLHIEPTKTGSRLIAIDGNRLHVAEINRKIESGDYKPVITRETIELKDPVKNIVFPNWTKVLPEKTVKKGTISLKNTGMGKNLDMTRKMTVAFGTFFRMTGEIVNMRFLEDLPKTEWSVYTQVGPGKGKHKKLILKRQGDPKRTYAIFAPLDLAG
ncbi:hypothetical protein FACS189473_2190 [Spirochaetia bacterium]|nr:hypothetical protein FACS189473_2190 [Spirochaetia bacterium]